MNTVFPKESPIDHATTPEPAWAIEYGSNIFWFGIIITRSIPQTDRPRQTLRVATRLDSVAR